MVKKIVFVQALISLVIFGLYSNLSLAKETLKGNAKISVSQYAPTWEEFCPPEYLNAQYKEILPYKIPKSENIGVAIRRFICPFEIAADAMLYVQKAEANNYWAMRRKAFEGEVKTCFADEKNALSCFMVVRQMEDNKNAQRAGQETQQAQQMQQAAQFAAQQTTQNSQMMIQNMNNIQTQMQAQQMNNNLNNINSSINRHSSSTNSNLHSINQNLNRINKKLR